MLTSVELFAGAGGLALGAARAGFRNLAVIEQDQFACETIRENQSHAHPLARGWAVHETDIRDFEYSTLATSVDLLCAGVPCQPFSVAGKGRAHQDERDLFAEVVRAARELRPKAILVENVQGLRRTRFKDYLEYLLLAIATPDLVRPARQSWRKHMASLQRRGEFNSILNPLRYDVYLHVVNAADYGVPQCRHRVFIVAFRTDLHASWRCPRPTHSIDALAWAQWRDQSYWKPHRLQRRRPGRVSKRFSHAINNLGSAVVQPTEQPWRTVRDALRGLPRLRRSRKFEETANHYLNPGARAYKGHSGSLIDEPAKTLKAGSHGVPGGENSLVVSGSRIRYFSVRECARLQTFPDDYVFVGPWVRMMNQVGNAVPVLLAETFAKAIAEHLAKQTRHRRPASVATFPVSQQRRRTA